MRAARVAARAAAVPAAPSATDARSWSRTFDITGGDFVTAEVAVDEAGTQTVTVRTDKPGSLLLHWGVADATAILCCLGGGFALRLLAIHYRWEMPKFVYHDEVH